MCDGSRIELATLSQRFNQNVVPCWPGQHDGIERFSPGGKANILAGEWFTLIIAKIAFCDLNWSFAKDSPGLALVDCFAVYCQPASNGEQDFALLFGYC